MFDSLLFDVMFVIFLGILSQWLAWRFQLPAIVLMSIAGLLAGPIFGIMNPEETFGDMFSPIISLAVAIILFEGSLNLDFREIRELNKPLYRIITFGAFIAWIAGSLAAHYLAGLSWAVAFVIGGLFIVTGPTVILPLLRQAKLKPRPAAILKWEGIIVDPFGALLAVFAFELIKFLNGHVNFMTFVTFFGASVFAALIGWALGRLLGWMFEHGNVPEFLKSPIVFAVVLLTFVVADEIMHETGLLAVTAMGITMANMHISSIGDMRHFKENISVLLISSIFIMLTASLSADTLLRIFDLHIIVYVLAMLFIVRPLSIWLSTIGTDLTLKERTLVGWIAPRGIVALTVSGYFASAMVENGYKDAELLTTLTFALAFSTVVVHGFSIGWLAKKLDLAVSDKPGVLIIGASPFSTALAKSLKDLDQEVCIMDNSWARLSEPRQAGIKTEMGLILSEQTEYHTDLTPYSIMIAATESDSYNALICTNFVPELGRSDLYQTMIHGGKIEQYNKTIGGQILFNDQATIYRLNERVMHGHVMRKTLITEQFTYDQYLDNLIDSTWLLYIVRANKQIDFFAFDKDLEANAGDTIVSLAEPTKEIAKIKERIDSERLSKEVQSKE